MFPIYSDKFRTIDGIYKITHSRKKRINISLIRISNAGFPVHKYTELKGNSDKFFTFKLFISSYFVIFY